MKGAISMKENRYLGHPSQLYGVEQYRLLGGKGDGMRLFQARNCTGMEFTVSADRCADISRLRCNGINLSYFSPTGYVSPQYYDDKGRGFLKSFTGGFLTTCGLNSVGVANKEGEEEFPMHGTVGNSPAEEIYYKIEDKKIIFKAKINQMQFFGHKLILKRKIICPLYENKLRIEDTVCNVGVDNEPVMLLYHMNMGYPLLSENAEIWISSDKIVGRDDYAQSDVTNYNRIDTPTAGFREKCYYHFFEKSDLSGNMDDGTQKIGHAAIFNKDINLGLHISFNTRELGYFTQWNMFGVQEYVMGLEPSNCIQEGREKMRQTGKLVVLGSGEECNYNVDVEVLHGKKMWEKIKNNK